MSTILTIGWRERLSLPELGIDRISCKVDTGARTSSLHAVGMETFRYQDKDMIRFDVLPRRKSTDTIIHCQAELLDHRIVRNSGGCSESRAVIRTPVRIGSLCFPIEITLTNRENMRYRMLLGRTGLTGRFLVDPSRSYLMGKS